MLGKNSQKFDPRIRIKNSGIQESFPRIRPQIQVPEVQNPLCRLLSLRDFRGSFSEKTPFAIFRSGSECTKIAHCRSLAIFAADSGIAGNSAVGIKFVPFNRRENRRSLTIFFAEQIAPLGALKIARSCGGAVKIAAATAENRAILVHSGPEFLPEKPSKRNGTPGRAAISLGPFSIPNWGSKHGGEALAADHFKGRHVCQYPILEHIGQKNVN